MKNNLPYWLALFAIAFLGNIVSVNAEDNTSRKTDESIAEEIELRRLFLHAMMEALQKSMGESEATTATMEEHHLSASRRSNTQGEVNLSTDVNSSRKAGDVCSVNIAGVPTVFHWCPPGKFMMGWSTKRDSVNLEPQHEVSLTKGFWLCEVPVTVSAFHKFVNAVGYKTEAEKEGNQYTWEHPGLDDLFFDQGASHPVVCVSWNDAQAYISWLNANYAPKGMEFKLPSEAQWEYVCRAGSKTIYWWGNNPGDCKGKANVGKASTRKETSSLDSFIESLFIETFSFDDGYAFTSPVGSFQANNWGLKDMIGNVWEWCSDWFAFYSTGAATDPWGSEVGSNRVVRGGGWNSSNPWICRSAHRGGGTPDSCSGVLGFRLELTEISR